MDDGVEYNPELFYSPFYQFFLGIPNRLRTQAILEQKQQQGLNANLLEEIEELFDELAAMENLLTQGRQFFFEFYEYMSAKLRSHITKGKEMEEQLDERNQEVQMLKGNLNEIQDIYRSIDSRNRILNSKIDELERDQRRLEETLCRETEEKFSLTRKLREFEMEATKRSKLSEATTEVSGRLSSSSAQEELSISQINQSAAQLVELREKVKKLEKESSALRTENEDLNERHSKLMENYKITLSIKEKLDKLKLSHIQQIAQLREENDLLKIQIANYQNEQEKAARLNTDITDDFKIFVRNTNHDHKARMSFAAFDFNHGPGFEGFNYSFTPRESSFPLQKNESGVSSLLEKVNNVYGRESETRRQLIGLKPEKHKPSKEKSYIKSLLCCARK